MWKKIKKLWYILLFTLEKWNGSGEMFKMIRGVFG